MTYESAAQGVGFSGLGATNVGDLRRDVVERLALWCERNLGTPTARVNRSRTSYTWKHLAEDVFGEYVSNGEFIIAARMAGFKTVARGGLNVYLNISNSTFNRLNSICERYTS